MHKTSLRSSAGTACIFWTGFADSLHTSIDEVCVGDCIPASVRLLILLLISPLVYCCRDNPSERLGYLRAGLKDIKSHRLVGYSYVIFIPLYQVPLPSPNSPHIETMFIHFKNLLSVSSIANFASNTKVAGFI